MKLNKKHICHCLLFSLKEKCWCI